jgi:imidazoleglycerol-phosphate dehydratase
MEITVVRKTSESKILVTLDTGRRDIELKKKINTSLQFFNHMIETIAWRACMNIQVEAQTQDYKLTHVICEDVGLTMGEAFYQLFKKNAPSGINGDGSAMGAIDESLSRTVISFEERALLCWDAQRMKGISERVEDMLSADLCSFFEGFVQGARATLHIEIFRGFNPHHVWESVFRAFGASLRIAFSDCPWRSGTTPGVKGNVELETACR